MTKDPPVRARPADEIVARLERLPFSRFHLHLASVLGVGTFFDAYDALMIGAALTVIFTTLHIGFTHAGLLLSSAYVGQFVGALVLGYFSEKYGRRLGFVIALFFFGVTSLFGAFAWNFQSLVVIRILQGIGLGAEVPIAGTMFNEYVRGASRGKVVMIYESLFSWGQYLTPFIAFLVLSTLGRAHGWRALFLLGGIPILVSIYAYFRLPESARWLADKGRYDEADRIVSQIEAEVGHEALAAPVPRYRADVKPTRFSEIFQGIYAKRTFQIWAHWFTAYFVSQGLITWLPALQVQIGHLTPERALLLSAVTAPLSLALIYIIAFLFDIVGRKPIFAFGYILAALATGIGAVAVGVFHVMAWPVLWGVGFFVSSGIGFNTVGLYLYTPEQYPTRMRAWATATGSSVARVASIVAPSVVGGLLGAKFGIATVLAVLCAVALIGLMLLLVLGIETKERTLEELSP